MIAAKNHRGMGKALRHFLAVVFAFAVAQSAWAAVIDMEDNTVSTTDLSAYKYNNTEIKNNELRNGTLNVTGNQGFADGTFTFGSGLTVNQTANQWGISGGRTVKFIDGGTLNYTSTSDIYFGRLASEVTYNGTSQLILDGGIVNASAALYFSPKASSSGYDKNVVLNFIMANDSSLTLPTDKELRFGEVTQANSKKHATVKVTAAITNSTITAKQVRVGQTTSYISNTANSFNAITFGPGTVLNVGQVYSYAYPAPTIVLDGAKICWNADKGDSILGQNDGVPTGVYTIGPNGIVIDKQNGFSRTEVSPYASALSGSGGITKTGPGNITWNYGNIGGNRSNPMTFTGPLVISNGTWTSKLGYAASAFRADGGTLVLTGPLSAANVELAATEGGTLTLAGATITDASPDVTLAGGGSTDYFTRDGVVGTYPLDSFTLGPGAVLELDANATEVDAIAAATTNITATAEDKATIILNFSAAPAGRQTFTLFETDSADKFNIVLKLGSLTPQHTTSVVDGHLVIAIVAESYTWKGTQTYWGDANAWTTGGADATWEDGNSAIFGIANAEAVLASPVVASKVEMLGNATISGSATLTAADVSVADGIAATISAPTYDAMAKTGAGTLTLTQNRTDQTTLADGTLVMASATVDGTKLTIGVDAAKPVTFDYCGQTLLGKWTDYLAPGADITLTNGTFSTANDPAWLYSTMPNTLTIAKGATMTTSERFTWNVSNVVGVDVTNIVNIAGGSLISTKDNNNWFVQNSRSGTLVFNVTDGGLLELSGQTYVLPCRDSTTADDTPSALMTFNDSTFRVKDRNLFLGYDNESKKNNPKEPILELAMTNSTLDVGTGIIRLGHNAVQSNHGGHSTADFENCVITAKQFSVHFDRPANAARFNNSTIVITAAGDYSIEAQADWDTQPGAEWAGRTPITVGSGGLTVDTQDFACSLQANLHGDGAVTKVGSGKLTVVRNQTSTADFICAEGETFLNAGRAMNRPVTVKNGAKFTVKANEQSTITSLTLEAGSTLNIDTYTIGVTPFAVETLTLPSEGKATLNLSGASFKTGRYAILSKPGIVAGDFANLEVSGDGVDATYSVEDGTLYVNATAAGDYIWTGAGDGVKFSDGANWMGDSVPPNGANLHIGVASGAALVCDIEDFSPAAITFSVGSAAVTIDGDYAISGVAAITNLSSASHTINVPVHFASGINVKQNASAYETRSNSHVTFEGGAYAASDKTIDSGYSVVMFGKYYFANTSDWTATEADNAARKAVADNSSLYIPYAGRLTELYIGSGSKVDVGAMASNGGRVSYRNCGEMVVTNLTLTGTGDRFTTHNQTSSTSVPPIFKFERIETSMTGNWFYFSDDNVATKGVYYIGAGGLNFSSASAAGCYCIGRNVDDDAQTLRPWYSDFTIADRGDGNKGLVINRAVTFCTDDEGGTGRTITVDAIVQGNGSPTITVSGSGTLRVNKAAANATQPSVTVKNTATLAIKPGASLTTNTTTLNSGTTLQVAESGTVALGGSLAFKAGAKLGFNYTTKDDPVLDLTDKTVTFDENAATKVLVKITAAEGKRGHSGARTLTVGGKFADATAELVAGAPDWVKGVSVVDGDIVIDVRSVGTIFSVR